MKTKSSKKNIKLPQPNPVPNITIHYLPEISPIEKKEKEEIQENKCSLQGELVVNQNIQEKLDYFYVNNQIPNIIFHGSSGSGKKTVVFNFIKQIYENDKQKIKENVMVVNCSHGKGIKFIREELKFFAKANFHFSSKCNGIKFKIILLLNAESLTTDAQSALRRCIELFSYNTRFFMIVENKHKLLNPILSRFCEIHIPGNNCNLHQYNLDKKFPTNLTNNFFIENILDNIFMNKTLDLNRRNFKGLIDLSNQLYNLGYSCLDIIQYIRKTNYLSDVEKTEIIFTFYKIKTEFRCEKLLMFHFLCIIHRS